MKKTVLTYGLISGTILLVIFYGSMAFLKDENGNWDLDNSMVVGYINMLVALSMVFLGIRQYRENYLGGKISFGRAFKVGILISLIACAMYVIAWMIYYNTGDVAEIFSRQYTQHMKEKWTASGMSEAELSKRLAEMEKNWTFYKNPVVMAGFTLMEILPIAILITLLSALILKKK